MIGKFFRVNYLPNNIAYIFNVDNDSIHFLYFCKEPGDKRIEAKKSNGLAMC